MRYPVLAAMLVAMTSVAPAGDWPQFRGPGATGVVDGKLPSQWSPEVNVRWKVAIPGAAWSCPVVIGDKIIVTTAITENQVKPRSFGGFGGGGGGAFPGGRPGGGKGPPEGRDKEGQGKGKGGRPGGGGGGYGRGGPPNAIYQWRVMCLDRDSGKVLWNELALEAKPRIGTHGSNTFASETPVSDGERIYAYFGMTGLFCYDLNGKLVWKKDLGHQQMQFNWGTSSSPVLDAGKLFIQCDNEEKSYLVALDSKTGDEKWRVDREEKSGWSTPYIWRTKNRTDLVTIGSNRVRGYNPADGKLVWELSVGGGQCAASPVGDEERLYVGTSMQGGGGMGGRPGGGRPGGDGKDGGAFLAQPPEGGRPGGGRGGFGMGGGGKLFAIKAGATGDISLKGDETSNAGVAWVAQRSWPAAASPLLYQGHVYVLERAGGMISCFDAATGKPAYSRQRINGAKAFWASPWANDGKIFALDDDGQTHVIKAGPKFELLGKNDLTKELYWSSPAAADGKLYIRGVDHLYCIAQ